jgi:hypothetical protein
MLIRPGRASALREPKLSRERVGTFLGTIGDAWPAALACSTPDLRWWTSGRVVRPGTGCQEKVFSVLFILMT